MFIDTTIQIYRALGEDSLKDQIESKLKSAPIVTTGTIVRLEFMRRVINDCVYLRGLLKAKSFADAIFHVNRLPTQQSRKKNICISLIGVLEKASQDKNFQKSRDKADFCISQLEMYIEFYDIMFFSTPVTHTVIAPCHKGQLTISWCSKTKSYTKLPSKCEPRYCQIQSYLMRNKETLEKILATIERQEKPSHELVQTAKFISDFIKNHNLVKEANCCSVVGDLLIALESSCESDMYTGNKAESAVLCQALNQTLIYRPPNPQNSELVFAREIPNESKRC